MKTIITLLLLMAIMPAAAIAQKAVTAESVIKSINNHEAVSLSGAEITGDLDLTKLSNMKLQSQNSGDKSDKIYISTVTVSVSLINCNFTGNHYISGTFYPI